MFFKINLGYSNGNLYFILNRLGDIYIYYKVDWEDFTVLGPFRSSIN